TGTARSDGRAQPRRSEERQPAAVPTMPCVRRGALAGVLALALAAAGLLAAAVASGAGPLSPLTTTGGTGTTTTVGTTAPEPVIAAGVSIGGVPVGGLTSADAYDA